MTELDRVKRAARRKEAALEDYRAALVAARDAGHTEADVAAAAGIAQQSVNVIVKRARARV